MLTQTDHEEIMRQAKKILLECLPPENTILSEAEQKTVIVRLMMALGLSIALLADCFFGGRSSPEEFGDQLGKYITEMITKIKEAGDGSTTAKKSGWTSLL